MSERPFTDQELSCPLSTLGVELVRLAKEIGAETQRFAEGDFSAKQIETIRRSAYRIERTAQLGNAIIEVRDGQPAATTTEATPL